MRWTRTTFAIVTAVCVVTGCSKATTTTTGSSSSASKGPPVTLSVADSDLTGLDSALSDMGQNVDSAATELSKTES
jgi:hypothetical protein